jgi:DNA-binding beta-propeller fold protein YncE
VKDSKSFYSAFSILLLGLLLVTLAPIAFTHSSAKQVSTSGASDPGGYGNSTIATTNVPTGIAVNNQTGLVYVGEGSKLDVINGSTNSKISTISLPSFFYKGADDVAVDPNTNMVYVSVPGLYIGVSLVAVNGSTGKVVKTLGFWGGAPIGADLAVNPNTNIIYAAVPSIGGGITVINGSSYQSSGIPLTDPNCTNGCSFIPEGVAANPSSNLVYAVGENSVCGSSNASCYNDLLIINGTTNSIVQRIGINGTTSAYLSGYDPFDNEIYVSTDNALDVFNGSSYALIAQIQIPSLTFAPATVGFIHNGELNDIYIDSTKSCSNIPCDSTRVLDVINASSFRVLKTISLGTEYNNFRAFLATYAPTNSIYTECCGNVIQVFTKTNANSTLTIKTQGTNGSMISGFNTMLNQSGSPVASAPTIAIFRVSDGENYTVQINGNGSCSFDHWADNGNTTSFRAVSISRNTTLTAVIKCAAATTSKTSTTTSISSSFVTTATASSSLNKSSATTSFTSSNSSSSVVQTNSTATSSRTAGINFDSTKTATTSSAASAAPIPNFLIYAVAGSIIAVIVLALGFAYLRERQKIS